MPYLLFLKKQQHFNCCLLQIIGGAVMVKISTSGLLKSFLLLALVDILFSRVEQFVQY